jgi:hypothetical protein
MDKGRRCKRAVERTAAQRRERDEGKQRHSEVGRSVLVPFPSGRYHEPLDSDEKCERRSKQVIVIPDPVAERDLQIAHIRREVRWANESLEHFVTAP